MTQDLEFGDRDVLGGNVQEMTPPEVAEARAMNLHCPICGNLLIYSAKAYVAGKVKACTDCTSEAEDRDARD